MPMRRGELYRVFRPGADRKQQRVFAMVSRQALVDMRFSTSRAKLDQVNRALRIALDLPQMANSGGAQSSYLQDWQFEFSGRVLGTSSRSKNPQPRHFGEISAGSRQTYRTRAERSLFHTEQFVPAAQTKTYLRLAKHYTPSRGFCSRTKRLSCLGSPSHSMAMVVTGWSGASFGRPVIFSRKRSCVKFTF
jgi:hypothetical protein